MKKNIKIKDGKILFCEGDVEIAFTTKEWEELMSAIKELRPELVPDGWPK